MDEVLEKLIQEWANAMVLHEKAQNAFSRSVVAEARAQMEAAALVVIAQNMQKFNLHIDQLTTGPASLNVYATNEV